MYRINLDSGMGKRQAAVQVARDSQENFCELKKYYLLRAHSSPLGYLVGYLDR
jgi:hypothetical protein